MPARPSTNEEDEADTVGNDMDDQGGEAASVDADTPPEEGQDSNF